jgi:hypothetical protein
VRVAAIVHDDPEQSADPHRKRREGITLKGTAHIG